ncbi:vancomycin resistance protein YoaR [Hungatella effluvii]|uniref:Vancomycin resistance protein YoaR n=1 Tax=Hungatella effluvii TaxID=1096246 RepID=A0A2V3YM57_9FIRM|nr:VanW family protein [Hungatella effluvii]PXX55023.1 vancomycin resistance protein YoaR [Hungatella effluvii]
MKRGRSRRRRRQTRLVMYGGTVILLAAVLGAAGLAAGRRSGDGRAESAVEESSTASVAEHLAGTVTAYESTVVEGVDITGKSRSDAEKLLLEKTKGLSVVWQEENVTAEEETGGAVRRILDEIYGNGQMKTGTFSFDMDSLKESFRALAKTLAGKWNRAAADSQLVSFDKETSVYTYSEAKTGRMLNEESLVQALMEAVKAGNYAAVKPEFSESSPKRSAAQAKEQYQVIGSFTTKTTSNKNRNENIRLAVEAIDGRILKPGEEFSFNLATGNRTKEKGYQPAGAYRNGVLIEEPGGGVCQVSTTLYNAIVSSGLSATERHSHSFTPSYIQPGEDAMVSFDGYAGPDLKFVNSEPTTVAVRASLKDNTLKISIVGLPILEDGVKVTMRSEKVRDVEPPAPVYEANDGLPAGTEKVVDQGQKGGVWKTFRVVTKDGNVLEETPLHNTTYRGKASVIQKNENAAETGESSAEAGANESADGGQTQESAGQGSAEQDNAGQTSGVGNAADGNAGQQEASQQQAVPQQSPAAGADAVVVPAFPGT